MYVAITRARRRLFLTFAQTRMLHGQTRYKVKSRFLAELPDEALKWLSPQVQQQHHWFARPAQAMWDDAPQSGANKIAQRISKQDIGWRPGQTVYHGKFGEGVIVHIEGGGGSPRANINFGKHGMKLLDLSVAKLSKEPIS
jgi:DNA helicase-2/ATP-dependent DNA helicase PcrA